MGPELLPSDASGPEQQEDMQKCRIHFLGRMVVKSRPQGESQCPQPGVSWKSCGVWACHLHSTVSSSSSDQISDGATGHSMGKGGSGSLACRPWTCAN